MDHSTNNPTVVPTLWGFNPQSNGSVEWESQSSINPQSAVLASNVAGGLSATSPAENYNLGGFIDLSDNIENDGFGLDEMLSYNQSFYNLMLAGQHYMWVKHNISPSMDNLVQLRHRSLRRTTHSSLGKIDLWSPRRYLIFWRLLAVG